MTTVTVSTGRPSSSDTSRDKRVMRILRSLNRGHAVSDTIESSASSGTQLPSAAAGEDDLLHAYYKVDSMGTQQSLCNLLEHVKLDNDGGILNLATGNEQHSKVKALEKNFVEIMTALFKSGCVLLNVSGIIVLTVRVVLRYANHEQGPESKLNLSKQVPLVEMIVAVKLIETAIIIVTILKVLRHVVGLCCCDKGTDTDDAQSPPSNPHVATGTNDTSRLLQTEQPRSRAMSGIPHVEIRPLQKYIRISRVFWKLIPRLQYFSALQFAQPVLPSVLPKTLASFTWKDDAARVIMEKFLRKGPNTATDEELVDGIIRYILVLDHGLPLDSRCNDQVLHYLGRSLSNLMWTLLQAHWNPRSNREDRDQRADWSALDCSCRFRLVHIVENTYMVCFVIFAWVAAFIALFTKLCIFASLAMDEHGSTWVLIGFTLLFFNQALNSVDVQAWLIWRVKAFIFGGADANISREEEYIMNMYLAMLCQQVLDNERLSCLQKFAILMGLDDDDLQQLIVEEDAAQKSIALLGLLQFMEKNQMSPLVVKILYCALGLNPATKPKPLKARI